MIDAPGILVVDDKPNMVGLLTKVVGPVGRVVPAGSVREATDALARETIAVVVCDLRMPDGDGLEVLRALRGRGSTAPFILMTAYATVGTAVQAMREGAYDYVTKPFDPDDIRAIVERALAQAEILAPVPSADPETDGYGALLGRSPRMREVFRLIDRIAPTDATVLVLGETGTGKELVARAIHDRSPRAQHPFFAVNCAAIARSLLESELFGYAKGSFTGAAGDRPGVFEASSRSTLLLDEIGELRLSVQAKLTRVLEERAVKRLGETRERPLDVRLVGATHRDLPAMVKAGTFREDLWFRLNVCVITLPPLRDRHEDIPMLARNFLAERGPLVRSRASRFSDPAMAALEAYAWPGNVRELRSAVERSAILATGEQIQFEDLPPELRNAPSVQQRRAPPIEPVPATGPLQAALAEARDATTRGYIVAVLRRFGGDVVGAATHAGIERESFYRLMRRHGVVAADYRKGD